MDPLTGSTSVAAAKRRLKQAAVRHVLNDQNLWPPQYGKDTTANTKE
tara:strand:+ start:99 stop:239 length:141 start_codon:yes stop_codon:yes gene_type:complete